MEWPTKFPVPDGPEAAAEISPESLDRAEAVLWGTLDVEGETAPENFYNVLRSKVMELPRYKELAEKLEHVPVDQLFRAAYKEIQRASDKEESVNADTPDDGVLISSMKHGPLECAGRVLIASTYLEERGVPHMKAAPPGHSMMLAVVDEDTLAYADPNNDLYFTLPKAAVKGYRDAESVSECAIEEYMPREKDVIEGEGSTFNHFVTMPPRLGSLLSYVNNVQAALYGNDEFKKSGIAVDEKAAEALESIKPEILGTPDPVLEQWQARLDDLRAVESALVAKGKSAFVEIVRNNPDEISFVAAAKDALDGVVGKRYPYLQHASDTAKESWAKKLWQKVQANPQMVKKLLENR